MRADVERRPVTLIFQEKSAFKETYGGGGDHVLCEGQHLKPAGAQAKTIVLFMHPTGVMNYLPLPNALAHAGVPVMTCGSRYPHNDSALIMEKVVTDLGQSYRLLTPMLGTSLASLAFGVALLAAGQSSTITGTLAGQVVMEGFLDLRLPLWQRRLLTRGLALIPALATVLLLGEGATNQLLVLSQVVLSLQLPFAAVPLVWFCGQARPMGNLRSPVALQLLSWLCIGTIVTINLSLLISLAGTLRF